MNEIVQHDGLSSDLFPIRNGVKYGCYLLPNTSRHLLLTNGA